MPLTPLNKVHRTFPSIFAEKMSQHVKQRTKSYKEYRYSTTQDEDIVLEPLDDAEISEMCDSDGEVSKNSLGHSHSRLTPEMSMLKTFNLNPGQRNNNNNSESESDASSNTTTPRPSSSRPSTSPSPRGNPVKFLESPRPQATNFVPVFAISPRRPRQSPRTTGSLDNVDLWEESDNDSNDFDNVEGVMIDPLKTFDFSDLRRSKSPVACKRNKLSNVPHKPDTEHTSSRLRPSSREKSREKQHNAARARAARRLKQIFPNPAVSKPVPRLHIAKPSTNTVEHKDNLQPVSTAKKKLLPQRESRIAAKFPAIAIQDNESKQKLHLPKDKKTVLNEYNLRHKQLDKIPHVSADKQINKQTDKQINKPDKQMPPIKYSDTNCITDDKHKLKDIKPYKPELYKDNSLMQNDYSPNSTMEEPSVSRKVKFNSFVTVRDDQVNTLDFLKHSNNSAQMYKNKFLRNPNIEHPPSEKYGNDDNVNLMLQTIS